MRMSLDGGIGGELRQKINIHNVGLIICENNMCVVKLSFNIIV